MGNTHSTDTLHEALDNLPARTTRAESSYIGPNFSFLEQQPVTPPRHISLHQIYHTVFLLRQKLIPDVIPAILHHAGLFEHQTFRVDEFATTFHSGHGKEYDCLTTAPIRSTARIKCPVRRIIFEIESRETIWERRDGSCCWTRFTAGILPPPEEVKDLDGEVREFSQQGGLLNEREIGRHDSALREVKTYMLQWTVDSDDEEEREWVESLANGDSLVVRASALYPGFVNKIHTVSVALYMGAIV